MPFVTFPKGAKACISEFFAAPKSKAGWSLIHIKKAAVGPSAIIDITPS